MAKRKWIFGSLWLTIGILVGQVLTRAGMWPTPSATIEPAGIPLAISGPQPPRGENATLNLTDVVFCHKISSFGNYLTYDRDEFTAGQEVLLYAEIGNFHSEPVQGGNFRTLLKSKLEFFREGELHQSVERIDFPETEDLCRRPRHDYYHSHQFVIPETLTAGRYAIRLTVRDQLGDTQASRSLTLAIQ